MCIIVDANRLGVLLSRRTNEDVKPIHDWLDDRQGMIIYSTGGEFENDVSEGARRALAELVKSGKARFINRRRLESKVKLLTAYANYRSNDPHVLALAIVSGARLLYTADQALRDDFKKGKWMNGEFIIQKPRGKLYSSKNNSNLLAADVCKVK